LLNRIRKIMEPQTQITGKPSELVSISDLTKNTEIQKFFVNGFQAGFSLADGHIILKLYDIPQCALIMGFPAIKSLKTNLDALIKAYETNTKQNVSSIEELAIKLNEPPASQI